MSEGDLVRPNYLYNSTGELVHVKQWFPELQANPAISQNVNPEKNMIGPEDPNKVSQIKRGAQKTSPGSQPLTEQKDNLRQLATQQKSRVSISQLNLNAYEPKHVRRCPRNLRSV